MASDSKPAHLQSDAGLQATISEVQKVYTSDFDKRPDVGAKVTPSPNKNTYGAGVD